MSPRRAWILPVISAVVLPIAYATPWIVPKFVVFAPLLLWLDTHPHAGARARLRAGLLFGLVGWALTLHWMYAMLSVSALAVLLYVSLTAAFAAYAATGASLAGWIRERTGWSWGAILPVVWIPLEFSRAFGDLRMTADHVGNVLAKTPFLAQFADLVGPYGLGAAVLALNGWAYEIVFRRGAERRRAALGALALALAVLGYDAWAWNHWSAPSADSVRVGIVQPNVSIDDKSGFGSEHEQSKTLKRLTRRAAADGATLVVWPETARPYGLYHDLGRPETLTMPELEVLARVLRVSMLVGVDYGRTDAEGRTEWYNAAFAIGADGRLSDRWAAKSYLVPFVEKVPFETWLGGILRDRGGEWRWLSGGFRPGPEFVVLPFAHGGVGVQVCYEQLFAEVSRNLRREGAEFQAVITNDAWWGRSVFQQYQRDVLRLRAIETRTGMVRAANTGISGIVDRRGRYVVESGLFEEAVLVGDLERAGPETVYVRYGDVTAWVALAGLLVAIAAARRGPAGRPPGSGEIVGGT